MKTVRNQKGRSQICIYNTPLKLLNTLLISVLVHKNKCTSFLQTEVLTAITLNKKKPLNSKSITAPYFVTFTSGSKGDLTNWLGKPEFLSQSNILFWQVEVTACCMLDKLPACTFKWQNYQIIDKSDVLLKVEGVFPITYVHTSMKTCAQEVPYSKRNQHFVQQMTHLNLFFLLPPGCSLHTSPYKIQTSFHQWLKRR